MCYRPFFILLLSWSSAGFCGTMIMIQLELVQYLFIVECLIYWELIYVNVHYSLFTTNLQSKATPNSMIIVTLLSEMFSSIIFILIFCEVGEKVSQMFVEIDREIIHIQWFWFPIEVQRYFVIILSFGQKTVCLNGFGSISGSREVFKHVRI